MKLGYQRRAFTNCATGGLWLLCPYDTTALPDGVIDEALRSHPVLADADGYRGNTQYGGAHRKDTTALPDDVIDEALRSHPCSPTPTATGATPSTAAPTGKPSRHPQAWRTP